MAVPLAVSMVARAMPHGHFGSLSVNEAPVRHRPVNQKTILTIALTQKQIPSTSGGLGMTSRRLRRLVDFSAPCYSNCHSATDL